MDLYTNSTFQDQKGCEIGSSDHMTQFRNFVTLITFEGLELSTSKWWAVKQLLTHPLQIWYAHWGRTRPVHGPENDPKWVWPG